MNVYYVMYNMQCKTDNRTVINKGEFNQLQSYTIHCDYQNLHQSKQLFFCSLSTTVSAYCVYMYLSLVVLCVHVPRVGSLCVHVPVLFVQEIVTAHQHLLA